jgi:hypothetical protein
VRSATSQPQATGGIAVRNYVAGGDAACFLRLQSCTTHDLLDSRFVASRLRKNDKESGLTPLLKDDRKGVGLQRCARILGLFFVILGRRPRIQRIACECHSWPQAENPSCDAYYPVILGRRPRIQRIVR